MNRSEYNRSQTITAIQDCFMKLYGEIGLDKITVQAVCQECSVSRTIFYKYFDDKYSVLESVEQELLDGLEETHRKRTQPTGAAYRQDMPFSAFFETAEYIRENEIYFKPLLGIHGDPQFIFRWKQQIRRSAKEEFESNHITGNNLDIAAELIASASIGLFEYWLIEDPALTAEEISGTAGNLLKGTFYKTQSAK